MTEDTRLQRLHQDPRFRRAPKKAAKLSVDPRFKAMFEDENFGGVSAKMKKEAKSKIPFVDKYGRPLADDRDSVDDLKRFYRLESEDDDKSASAFSKDGGSEISGEDVSEISAAEAKSSDSFAETSTQELYNEHPAAQTSVPLGGATRRLAIVNIDWDNLRAIDLLHLLSAFKPSLGAIKSVKIYLSEFGKERMKMEALHGPPEDIFKDSYGSDDKGGSYPHKEDIESDSEAETEDTMPLKQILEEEGKDFDEVRLRKYQLERLRYYYAVVECDSIDTAAVVYRHCDGVEFEKSANFLDLRYIPDGLAFAEEEVKDEAAGEDLSTDYKPRVGFVTDALQHSRVKLTWDLDGPDRQQLKKTNFQKFDFREDDYQAYLASNSEDEDERVSSESDNDGEAADDRISKMRKLLLSGNNDGDVFGRKSREADQQLEITFTGGLDAAIHSDSTLSAKEDDHEETIHEAYLRKKAERKQTKRAVQRAQKKEEKATLARKPENKGKHSHINNAENAEMDLLLMDDAVAEAGNAKRHFNLADIIKSEKRLKTKLRSKKASKSRSDGDDGSFKINVEDDRFKAIYDSPDYSIDPTHPSFKSTTAMQTIIAERQKRLAIKNTGGEHQRRISKV